MWRGSYWHGLLGHVFLGYRIRSRVLRGGVHGGRFPPDRPFDDPIRNRLFRWARAQQAGVEVEKGAGLGLPGPLAQYVDAVVRLAVAARVGEDGADRPYEVGGVAGAEDLAVAQFEGGRGHRADIADDHGQAGVGVFEVTGGQYGLVVRELVDRQHPDVGGGQERRDLVHRYVRQHVHAALDAELGGA